MVPDYAYTENKTVYEKKNYIVTNIFTLAKDQTIKGPVKILKISIF